MKNLILLILALCLIPLLPALADIQPPVLQEIPTEYFSPAEQQGKLEELYYDTWESFTYEEHSHPLTKRAIVYLPYGYDETQPYNIFYYMHGGWGNETTTLGTPDHPGSFKNVIDHAIQDGKMKPMIIVCPTYNNTNENGQDSDSFSLAMQLNRQLYHETFNDLLPAVESRYSTYTEDTTLEGLKASREHRGFGGFSMGSVATWRTFEHGGLEYFYYFMPMSCGTSMDDDVIQAAARDADPGCYFIWVMTGTQDFAYSYDNNRVDRMRNTAWFTEATAETEGNFTYYVKDGYGHDGTAAMEYSYNGLCWFWNH